MSPTLPDVPHLAEKSASFRAGLWAAAQEAQIDADALAAAMGFESGFQANAVNPSSGASGLIQWMPSTAHSVLGIDVETLRQMSDIEQLPLVVRTFQKIAPHGLAADDVYVAIFSPAFIGRSDDTEMYREGQLAYDLNRGLDGNKDGVITVGDVRNVVRSRLSAAGQRPRLDASGPSPPTLPGAKPSGGSGGTIGVLIGAALGLLIWLRKKS